MYLAADMIVSSGKLINEDLGKNKKEEKTGFFVIQKV